MALNSIENAEQSFISEDFVYGNILIPNPSRYRDVRKATQKQDMEYHYDLAWFDLHLEKQVFGDVKTVEFKWRNTGNYSVSNPCFDYVMSLPECFRKCYYWILELYGDDHIPTGRYRVLNCDAVFRNVDAIIDDRGMCRLLNLDKAVKAIPEGDDNFVIESDIPLN